jgi:hypothetical protein
MKNKPELTLNRKKARIGLLIVFVAVLALISFMAVIAVSYYVVLVQLRNRPEPDDRVSFPTYDLLPILQPEAGSDNYYSAGQPSPFTHLNTFVNISSWSNFQEVPLAVDGSSVIIAGSIGGDSGVNLPLLHADVPTGKVNWQTVVGSGNMVVYGDRLYTQTPDQPFGGATGIVAYDLLSGTKMWETTLDWRYAIGVNYLAVNQEYVIVQTYHRGNSGFYLLHPETGEIQQFREYSTFFAVEAGTYYDWNGGSITASGTVNWEAQVPGSRYRYQMDLAAPVIYEQLILVKNGHRALSPLLAIRKTDGAIIWQFDESVVSNVAVGGTTTFVVTENAELKALDTLTGNLIGSLQFTPAFAEDYDFVNNSIIVAADDNIVAVYFRDSRQLSVFQFGESN